MKGSKIMTFEELHEKYLIEVRKKNLPILRKQICKNWVTTKINNYKQRYDIKTPVEVIRQRILVDDEFAYFFIKEPNRQGVSEKTMLEMLGVDKLPQSGSKAICFNPEGNIVHDPKGIGNSKAADCIWNGCYTALKYTKDYGGSQDNQKNDVVLFLMNASKTHKVYAILEGAYYDNGWRAKLKEMFKDNPNVVIASINEVLGDK